MEVLEITKKYGKITVNKIKMLIKRIQLKEKLRITNQL